MKKSQVVYPLFMAIFAFFAIFLLSACGAPLRVPAVERAGATLTWENTGAYRYQVVLDELEVETTAPSFDMMPYLDTGTHTVKVKSLARPGSLTKSDSDFSEPIEFEVGSDLLTPTGLVVSEELNTVTATFDEVEYAESYTLKIEKEGVETKFISLTSTSVAIQTYLKQAGTYQISVRAETGDLDGDGIHISAYSDSVECINSVVLAAPEIKSFIKNGSAYDLRWAPVECATSYVVSVLGSDKTIETTGTSANLFTIEGGLPDLDIQVAFVQAVAEGLYKASDFSDGRICYGNNSSKTQFAALEVDFFKSNMSGDTTFDFNIGSAEELNDLMYFAILYRIGEINFYFDGTFGSGDINSKAQKISAAINEFPEIMALSRGVSSDYNGMITVTLDFTNPSSPSLVSEGNIEVNQVDMGEKLNSFGAASRAEDFTDFAIWEREKQINVYTSEQLFQVVAAGYKPILIEKSPAKKMWDIACNILKDIIDDSMTDYQKTLAIFEWVCYNNTYDRNLLDNLSALEYEQSQLGNSSADEARYDEITCLIRSYKAFYIEGMLLDDGVAVCDGIAKTFALLCNIEGIESYKVNGVAGGNGVTPSYGDPYPSSFGGHAWNKVALDIDDDGDKEWYTVDCTWNDYYYSSGISKYTEILTHSYFLITDDSILWSDTNRIGTHYEEGPLKDVSDTAFDYHTFTTFDIEGTEFDLYVNEASEIETLLDFLKDNFEYFEIKVDKDLDSTVVSNLSGYVCMAVEETADYYVVVVYK